MKRLDEDIQQIFQQTTPLWENLRNQTVFLTGGTGFFGVWFQHSFIYSNRRLKLNAKMIILTRRKSSFYAKYPELVDQPEISFIEGDIADFIYPEERINYIIHAATEASVKLNAEMPIRMFDTIVNGTKHVLELARRDSVKSFLFCSSGAVYGKQPSDITHLPETYNGAPETMDALAVYGEGKRMAEVLCAVYHKHFSIPVKIARCYAFLGPYLPLDTHFAAGNFINQLLAGQNITVSGDGTPFRSYLYPSDLMIWLWTIMMNGQSNYPYNVGSDHELTIEDLAGLIVRFDKTNETQINILTEKSTNPPARYVPSVDRAKIELGLTINVNITEAINKTLSFYGNNGIV
jgi:dTDP-glucose 4,6-dehydratase